MNQLNLSKRIAVDILAIAVILSVALIYKAFAWQEASQAPPNGNVPAPLNVGNTGQIKEGGLMISTGNAVNGLIVQNGNVGIGTITPAQKLQIIGGKAQADDFCLNSDPTKCLSNSAGGGGAGGAFGGLYVTGAPCGSLGPGSCGTKNPLTNACTCPAGYTATILATLCGGFPGTTNFIQCTKK